MDTALLCNVKMLYLTQSLSSPERKPESAGGVIRLMLSSDHSSSDIPEWAGQDQVLWAALDTEGLLGYCFL